VLPSTRDYLIEQILDFLGVTTGIKEYTDIDATSSRIIASPNPARDMFRLSTVLQNRTNVRVEFFNVLGQRVSCLTDRQLDPGSYEWAWDFRDEKKRNLAAGTYFYRVKLGGEVFTGKILRIE
jgi:flagellar hook assembly protein FlgD